MKIRSFRYENRSSGWKTDWIELNGFNLLVGASGVGKTRILMALMDLKDIALGNTSDGVRWTLHFELNGEVIHWEGAFSQSGQKSTLGPVSEPEPSTKVPLEFETLTVDGVQICSRKGNMVTFKGEELPVKLSPTTSVLKLLDEDETIGAISKAFKNRLMLASAEPESFYSHITPLLYPHFQTLESIRESELDSLTRLAMAYQNQRDIYHQIVEDFRSIFPRVLDTSIQCKFNSNITVRSGQFGETQASDLGFYIQERGVDHWLHHKQISSGMWKTLLLLVDHYLCANNSVILIDEIENSLGVNCIDILGELVNSDRGLQYVITSHHPYIINNVPISHWKIVVRKDGVVQTHMPDEFGLGSSKHEAFMQLIQLEAFTEGVLDS